MPKEMAHAFFAEFFCGAHHIPRGGLKPFGFGWAVNCDKSLSTFDFDELTRLVLLAHDRAIRVQVSPVNFRYLQIAIHYRGKRDGSVYERHPTIETALEVHRRYHPSPETTPPQKGPERK